MKLKPLYINNARIIITDDCPYSCRYCGVYYAKVLNSGLISDFDCSEIAGNEGSSVVIGRGKEKYLTPEDYTFLVKILKDNFGTNDITITGGDPFMRRDITEIINNITDLGIYVTTLTKGMPLFNKDIKSILGNCSRIIFSLDTLDADKYADLNLSLSNKELSKKALSKTIETIEIVSQLGYTVNINTVVEPYKNIRDIIGIMDLAVINNVKKVKFLELESEETLGRPYIEEYFSMLKESGYFDRYGVLWDKTKKDQYKLASFFCSIGNTRFYTQRTNCLTSRINGDSKHCDLRKFGELNINQIGEIVTCQKKPFEKLVSLRSFIVNRDSKGLVNCIMALSKKTGKQTCAMAKNNGRLKNIDVEKNHLRLKRLVYSNERN